VTTYARFGKRKLGGNHADKHTVVKMWNVGKKKGGWGKGFQKAVAPKRVGYISRYSRAEKKSKKSKNSAERKHLPEKRRGVHVVG